MEVDMLSKNVTVSAARSQEYAHKAVAKQSESAQKLTVHHGDDIKKPVARQNQNIQPKRAARNDANAVGANGEVYDVRESEDEYPRWQISAEEEYESSGSRELLDKAIEEANKKIAGYKKRMEYSVHEATNDIMVKIINSETEEVVKELPPEKTLDAVAKMLELAGILVDEKG
ncbi:MAG: flagellar protein FlaG [Clostridiales bacterium]|jgi:flagellar protein FlaG|nr:flagellar protein FlaG [Clostridiales bacterium]